MTCSINKGKQNGIFFLKTNAQSKNNLFHYQWFFDENILLEKTTFNDQNVLANVITFSSSGRFIILITL
jgi:hypothetical protein